jgi:hypothetical protein
VLGFMPVFFFKSDMLVDNPAHAAGKATEIFCENIKVLLFKDEK